MTIRLIDGVEVEVNDQGVPVPAVVEPAAAPAPIVEPVAPVVTEPVPIVAAVAPVEPAGYTRDRMVPLPALLDERHKRRDVESELADAQARLQDYEAARAATVATYRPPVVDYANINTFEEFGRAVEDKNTFDAVSLKTAMSREIGLMRYNDFDDVLNESGVLADIGRDPVLARYLASQAMPAIAAYQIGLARVAPKRLAAARAEGDAAGAKRMVEKVILAAEAPVTLANAPASSAAAPTGLTLDKAAEMSPEEWGRLPIEVKDRLLRGEKL